jgi:hypothetical protein
VRGAGTPLALAIAVVVVVIVSTAGTTRPTLGEMIDAGTRVQVSLENGSGGPTLPNAFSGLVQETPFTFRRPRNLEAPSSCATNRGTPAPPVFQLNHWVTPAEPVTARRVNSTILRERVARCTTERGRGPTSSRSTSPSGVSCSVSSTN